jgi:hypothetical protein
MSLRSMQTVWSHSPLDFDSQVYDIVYDMERDRLDVEIQTYVVAGADRKLVWSATILGRAKDT